MKGISTILATILIVIIVVALVSLTYTFAVGLFRTSTAGAETSTTELTKKLQQSVDFVSASCSLSDGMVKFSIRHTGSVNITAGGLSALLNDNVVTTAPSITAESLNVGEVKSFNITGSFNSGDSVKITVSAPAAPIDYLVTC